VKSCRLWVFDMRCVARNRQTVYYSLKSGTTAVTDSDGNKTGEVSVTYSNPTAIKVNVSAAKGTVDAEQFGLTADYTKTIVTSDMACPIAEDSILWIGITPTSSSGGVIVSNPHNYIVKSIAKSLNSITYAVKRVEVGVNG